MLVSRPARVTQETCQQLLQLGNRSGISISTSYAKFNIKRKHVRLILSLE